jgi:ribosomal protein S27E
MKSSVTSLAKIIHAAKKRQKNIQFLTVKIYDCGFLLIIYEERPQK